MSVHITERPSCTEEIPPQARKKSPVSLHFISGGDGEWSDATRSIVPFASPFQRRLRLSFSRMGGAHLNSVAPRPMTGEERRDDNVFRNQPRLYVLLSARH